MKINTKENLLDEREKLPREENLRPKPKLEAAARERFRTMLQKNWPGVTPRAENRNER